MAGHLQACIKLAEKSFFDGIKSKDVDAAGLQFKTGKTWEDLRRARETGIRAGAGKFEREISEVAHRFCMVLKMKAKQPDEA